MILSLTVRLMEYATNALLTSIQGWVCKSFTFPVHTQPYYRDLMGEQQLPGAMAYYRATLSLPLFPAMRDEDVRRVVDALARSLPPAQ